MLVCYSLHSDYPDIIYSEILFHQRKIYKMKVEQTFLKKKNESYDSTRLAYA